MPNDAALTPQAQIRRVVARFRAAGLSDAILVRLGAALADGRPSTTWSDWDWHTQALLWGFLDLAVDWSGPDAIYGPDGLARAVEAEAAADVVIGWVRVGLGVFRETHPDLWARFQTALAVDPAAPSVR